MKMTQYRDLIQERNKLLDRYIRVKGHEKLMILTRIMDIDEELEEISHNRPVNMAQRVVQGKKKAKNEKKHQKCESLCFHCENARADRCPWIKEKKKIWNKAIEAKFLADNVRNREITIYKVTDCPNFAQEVMRA